MNYSEAKMKLWAAMSELKQAASDEGMDGREELEVCIEDYYEEEDE